MATFVNLGPPRNESSVCPQITRAHLIAAGLIFLSLLSVALLITVVVQARRGGKGDDAKPYCLDRGCLAAVSHQLRSVDESAAPERCKDFYKYACGRWQRTHPIESSEIERTILGDLTNRRDMEIESLLDSPITSPDSKSWEWKLKTYYVECRDDYARVPDTGKAMVGLIQDRDTINGWFLFDNGAANASQEYLLKNQTIYEQVSHIHGDLGANVGFGLRIKFDETNPNDKRLEFFPAGLSMDVNDYLGTDPLSEKRRSVYTKYMVQVLAFLAQDASINDGNLSERLLTITADVIAVERKLAEILKRNSGPAASLTFKEMSDTYSFDFIELMSHELGDPSVVSLATSVYVTNPMYFLETFQFFNTNDNLTLSRMIHNYMRWRLVRTYIEDLSYNYIHAHRTFLENYYGYVLHSSNEAYCTREVIRRFPLAIQRLYTRNSTIYPDASLTIENMFKALKSALKEYVDSQAKWMTDATTRAIAKAKIDAMAASIGYASLASNDARLNDYYERFAVDDKSHFENAYGYHRFHGWTLSNSLKNPDQLDHWDYFETRPNRLFDYIAIFNRLFVIANTMHEPLVNPEWPMSVNMGSLGVLLAQRLFASLDGPEGRFYAANGTRVPDWWSSSTANAYNESRRCITDYYVRDVLTVPYNVNGIEVSVQLAGEPFSPTTLRQIGALRFAYQAFKANDTQKSQRMPGTNLNSDQTFFLAYAQTQCHQRQGLVEVLRTQLGAYDERTALNAALVHMPEFTDAFQCPARANTCF